MPIGLAVNSLRRSSAASMKMPCPRSYGTLRIVHRQVGFAFHAGCAFRLQPASPQGTAFLANPSSRDVLFIGSAVYYF